MHLSSIEAWHFSLNLIAAVLGLSLSSYLLFKAFKTKSLQWSKVAVLFGLLITSTLLLIFLIVSLTVLKSSWGMVVLVPSIMLGIALFLFILYLLLCKFLK